MNEFDLCGQVFAARQLHFIHINPTPLTRLEFIAAQLPARFLEERALLVFERVQVKMELQIVDRVRRIVEPRQLLAAFQMFRMLFVIEFELNINLV
ncbi:MAG: hypothetical protein JMDDDDMK_03136 [Acidobacteria bacterium]|nr:hypothetical protein [Acidobacteriota bacterium]